MKTHDTNAALRPGPDCVSFAALLPVINEAGIDANDLTSLRAHLATCAYCQDQLASYERLDAVILRHLGPAAVPRLSAADILRGFAPERLPTTRALAADPGNERDALVMGRSHPQSNDQEPIDRHPFHPERLNTMQTPVLAFRARWTFLQRSSALAAAVLLVALVGSLVAGLVLVRNHGGAGQKNTGQTSASQESIYIATVGQESNSWVYKLNAQSHTLQWKKQIPLIYGCCIDPDLAVVDGVVYGITGLVTIYALDARNGTLLWQTTTPDPDLNNSDLPLVMGGGAIYLNGGNDAVYAFSTARGALLWHTSVAGNSTQAPPSNINGLTYSDGVLYGSEEQFPTQGEITESSLFALNASTGALLWRTPASDGQSFGAPQFANGMLFVVSFPNDGVSQPHVSAYNVKTGAQLWHSQLIYDNSPLTVVNGILYGAGNLNVTVDGLNNGYIYALNSANGALLWSYNVSDEFINGDVSPVVVDGVLYMPMEDRILALNASNGTPLWQYSGLVLDDGSLVVQGNTLYISLQTGILYAISASDGKEVWHTTYYPPDYANLSSAKITIAP